MIRVDISTLAFNSGAVDGNGTDWMVTKMEGWETPNQRQTFHDITTTDGVAIGDAQFTGRTLTFEGVVKATSEANFWTAYNQFNAVTAKLFIPFTLKVNEGGVVKTLECVRSSPPRCSFNGVGTFVFQIGLTAPYPIKQTEATVSAAYNGSITVTNGGSYSTFPIITMLTAGAPVFTNTTVGSAAVGFTGSLPAGAIIDFRKKTVVDGTGADYYWAINPLQSDWWSLAPGANNLLRSGGGTSTIAHHDGWI